MRLTHENWVSLGCSEFWLSGKSRHSGMFLAGIQANSDWTPD